MKPFSAILFALLFAVGQMGISFSVHHCMGKTSVSVFDVDFNKTCACDVAVAMPEGDGCCGNEHFTLKADTDTPTPQQASNFANSPIGFVAILFFQSQNTLNVSGNAQQHPVIKAHPNIGVPLTVLNSNFRI
jgi:hypothetical protein